MHWSDGNFRRLLCGIILEPSEDAQAAMAHAETVRPDSLIQDSWVDCVCSVLQDPHTRTKYGNPATVGTVVS